MVEDEVRKAGAEPVKVASVSLDFNEIVSKVRSFVNSIREMSVGEEQMEVSVEGFNFSLGKEEGKYDLCLNVSLAFKPKEPESVAANL